MPRGQSARAPSHPCKLPSSSRAHPTGAPPNAAAAALSRYRADFQETERLGKGGFGVVVAAINRLDNCKWVPWSP